MNIYYSLRGAPRSAGDEGLRAEDIRLAPQTAKGLRAKDIRRAPQTIEDAGPYNH